jgi:hypothetical protein
MDKLERVIKKTLTEQGVFADALKKAKGPTQGTLPSDPMAHLAAAAGKSVPALSAFSKELQKAKGSDKYYNPAYDSKSVGIRPYVNGQGSDVSTMNKELGVTDGMMPRWKNQSAYNALLGLGGRPFIATKGGIDFTALPATSVSDFVKNGEKPPGGIVRGVQVAMYNHPDRQVGMLVYFYEDPNKLYFDFGTELSYKYINWTYEASAPGAKPVIFLTRGGRKEGWLTHRGTSFTGEAIYVKSSDPMLNNIMKSDYIQDLRNYTGIESLFKHNEPTIIRVFGRDINLTALADRIQTGFDWVGIVFPPIDVINAVWYIGRGRYFEAFISIIALIPGVGDAVALIFKPFIKLFESAARGSKLIWNTLLLKAADRNISADVILKLFPGCIKFIETARTMRFLSAQQADDMIKWLNESKGFIVDFMKQNASAGVIANSKSLIKKLSKRLGYEYADDVVADQTANIFKRIWKKAGSKSLGGLVADTFKAAGRLAFSWLTKRSTNYWKAAYTMAYKQFSKTLLADPKKLAMCILSFGDNAISKQLTDLLFTTYKNILPKNAAGKYIFAELNARGIQQGAGYVVTEQQLRNYIVRNLPKALEQLMRRSKTTYASFVDTVVAAAAKPGEVINGYWTVFWTDPLRRFVNEYSGGRLISKFTGGVSGTVRNFGSDIVDGLKQLITSSDFLKRLDIIYNEFQEIFERSDYGTESDIDPTTGKKLIAGKDLNQQSVIFAIIDFGWTEAFGTPIVESMRSANEQVRQVSAVYDYNERVYKENIVPGDLDSLNFQSVVSDMPDAVKYKLSYWKKLVDAGKVQYQGGNSGMWVSLVNDPNFGIDEGGLIKGDIFQIKNDGRVTKVGSSLK